MGRILLIAVLVLFGCSDSKQEKSASAPPAASSRSAEEAQRELFEWPSGAAPSRDIEADLVECRKELVGVKNWVVGATRLSDCMTSKGWKLRSPQ